MDRRDEMNLYGAPTNMGRVDQRSMTFSFTLVNDEGDEVEYSLPCKFEVCDTCNGKGAHVNPSIDAHGISGEEWAEWDDEEREGYMSGRYDVECYECRGARVMPEIDRERTDLEVLALWDDYCSDLADSRRCEEMERRYGA